MLQLGDSHHHIYVPCNLGMCAILRLRCTFSESGNCVPILRLQLILRLHNTFAQSWDCMSAIWEHNRLMEWECLSWLMEEIWELPKMVKPNLPALADHLIDSLMLYDSFSPHCLESSWSALRDAIILSTSIFVPSASISSKDSPCWFNASIRHQLNKVHSLRRSIKRH